MGEQRKHREQQLKAVKARRKELEERRKEREEKRVERVIAGRPPISSEIDLGFLEDAAIDDAEQAERFLVEELAKLEVVQDPWKTPND